MLAAVRTYCLVGGLWFLVGLSAWLSFQHWQRENRIESWYERNGYKLVGGWVDRGYRHPHFFGVYETTKPRVPQFKYASISQEQFEAVTGEVVREDRDSYVVYSEYCVLRFFTGSEVSGPRGRTEERAAYERYWRNQERSVGAAPIRSR